MKFLIKVIVYITSLFSINFIDDSYEYHLKKLEKHSVDHRRQFSFPNGNIYGLGNIEFDLLQVYNTAYKYRFQYNIIGQDIYEDKIKNLYSLRTKLMDLQEVMKSNHCSFVNLTTYKCEQGYGLLLE